MIDIGSSIYEEVTSISKRKYDRFGINWLRAKDCSGKPGLMVNVQNNQKIWHELRTIKR